MKQFRASSRFQSFAISAFMFVLLVFARGRADAASRVETNRWNEIRNLAADEARSQSAWAVVESKCERFIKDYPQSDYVPDVLGVEARAMFKQQKWDAVIARFSNAPTNAVKVADQFAYWTARSYFEKNNYRAAAENFARLGRDYPSSPLRLEAIYRECDSYAKLDEWQRVVEELHESNGAFQQLAKTNVNDQWVVSGMLLLGEAELVRARTPKDFGDARLTLSVIASQPTRPELEWQRQFLLCRADLESGAMNEALAATTNLMTAAAARVDWRAKSVILKGEIYERLGQLADAAQTYKANLNGDLPAGTRQQALIRMVELTLQQDNLQQDKTDEAAQQLIDYLTKYPGEKGSDFQWLMLGELTLKKEFSASQSESNAPPAGQGTNLLQQAEDNFTKVIKEFTNSPFLGKAELDLGWCYTKDGKIPESLGAFSNAIERLPFSEDQAVARFKFADTLFALGNFGGAMTNYSEIIDRYAALPGVKNELFEQTLYQLVRACLRQTNSPDAAITATNAMNKILAWFPEKVLADRSLLLYGQSQNPAEARKVFSDLAERYPKSSLLPEVKLAVARTYEKEKDWPSALNQYAGWIRAYSNNPALPRAEFSLAWANYQAGNETNALQLFTNFVARFESNAVARAEDLPARAQYWIGDYYWQQGEYQEAELGYEKIFNEWPDSALALRAKMMAGCAVSQGQRPEKATNYFSSLMLDPKCPAQLKLQAEFAFADAAMAYSVMQQSATNDAAKFDIAIQYFYDIAAGSSSSNTPIAARAWGRLGDCYYSMNGDATIQAATNAAARDLALQRYQNASNYFETAMKSGHADVATRSHAEIRFGQTLAAIARLEPANREKFFEDALGHFWSVFYETNLRDNEQADASSLKDAGLEAGKLASEMGHWDQAKQIYQKLMKLMPPLQSVLEKKIAYADEQASASTDKNK